MGGWVVAVISVERTGPSLPVIQRRMNTEQAVQACSVFGLTLVRATAGPGRDRTIRAELPMGGSRLRNGVKPARSVPWFQGTNERPYFENPGTSGKRARFASRGRLPVRSRCRCPSPPSPVQREPAPEERIGTCRAPPTAPALRPTDPRRPGALRRTHRLGVSRAGIRASHFPQFATCQESRPGRASERLSGARCQYQVVD